MPDERANPFPRSPRILVVDDEDVNIRFLQDVLVPAGYRDLTVTTDPRRAMDLFREIQPDLILLDLRMPHLTGHELLALLKEEIPEGVHLPILVLTSDSTSEAKRSALANGAHDFLGKPLSPAEVRLRVRNLLETRFLHLALQEQNRQLEERVQRRTAELLRRTDELERTRVEILERLARAAEFRDDDTGLHTRRVGHVSALLAETLGVGAADVELIRRAAPLHDIGKIGIPDAILLKHGRLTPEEEAVMRTHTVIGAEILAGSDVPLLLLAQDIALSHHERWDGTGYPRGVVGSAIPLVGRVVAVVDVHDALTHPRPYKPAWSHADALTEIENQAGRQFDPDVVRAFQTLCSRIPLDALEDAITASGVPA